MTEWRAVHFYTVFIGKLLSFGPGAVNMDIATLNDTSNVCLWIAFLCVVVIRLKDLELLIFDNGGKLIW